MAIVIELEIKLVIDNSGCEIIKLEIKDKQINEYVQKLLDKTNLSMFELLTLFEILDIEMKVINFDESSFNLFQENHGQTSEHF